MPNYRRVRVPGGTYAFTVYPQDRLAIVVLTNLMGANLQNFIPKIARFYRPLQRKHSQ